MLLLQRIQNSCVRTKYQLLEISVHLVQYAAVIQVEACFMNAKISVVSLLQLLSVQLQVLLDLNGQQAAGRIDSQMYAMVGC